MGTLLLLLLIPLLLLPLAVALAIVELIRLRGRVAGLETRLRQFEQPELKGAELDCPELDGAELDGAERLDPDGPAAAAPLSAAGAASTRPAAGVASMPAAAGVTARPPAAGEPPGSLNQAASGSWSGSPAPPAEAEGVSPPVAPRGGSPKPEPGPRSPASLPVAAPAGSPRGGGLGARLPWRALERQLIENWTGLLGVLVLVAGVTFLVVNIALRLGPLARFLLTLAAAAALVAPSLRWSGHRRWGSLVAWLRSGGAALTLFACVAGGSLPELGLRWLEEDRQGLALVLAGMAVNLAVAARSRGQTVAALHVLVNLVPLLLVNPSRVTLVVATAVCLAGLAISARRPWHWQRLQVGIGFGLFQGIWLLRLSEPLARQSDLRLAGLGAALLLFGAGVLLQQRGGGPQPERLTPPRLAALTVFWGGLALALMVYPQQAASRVLALLAAAALALLLARIARGTAAQPLRTAQTLISQALVIAALLSLRPLLLDGLLLNLVLLLESGLFLLLGLQEPNPRLQLVGWVLVAGLALALLLQAWALLITPMLAPPPPGLGASGIPLRALSPQPWRPPTLLFGAASLLVGLAWQLERRGVVIAWPPLFSWQAAALVLLGAAGLAPSPWRAGLALLTMGGLLIADRRLRPPGLGPATALAIALAHLGSWAWLLAKDREPTLVLAQLLPLLALAVLQVTLATGPRRRALGLDLLGLSLGLAAQVLLRPLSPLLPAVAWLLLSLLALLVADRLRPPLSSHGLALGLLALTAYALVFPLEIASSSTRVVGLGLNLGARPLIELLAALVLAIWWRFQPRGALASSRLWQRCHPWFLELFLIAVLTPILLDLSGLWRPVGLALLALVLLGEPSSRWLAPRAKLHAVLVYWLSLVFGLLQLDGASAGRQELGALIAFQAVALQLLFALLAQRWLPPPRLREMAGLPWLGGLAAALAGKPQRWIWYPLFLVMAGQLASGFDHALLTLVWALEAFVIYALSAVLRDGQFRVVALIALAACLLRLLVVDMAEADLGVRGLVFVGVGLLMLAMNALYKRFEDRFR